MTEYLRFWQVEESIFLRELSEGELFQSEDLKAAASRFLHFARENYPSVLLLIGQDGMGKTSFLRWLYYRLGSENHELCYIPLLSLELRRGWLIQKIARFLGVIDTGPIQLEELLLRAAVKLEEMVQEGRRLLVLIDDAHLIQSGEGFADLSALLSMQSFGARCISFVLAGSAEMETLLAKNQNVRARVVMKYQIKPFTLKETAEYMQFRLSLAKRANVFTQSACEAIHRLSRGIPGQVNFLAENALFEGFTKKQPMIDDALVVQGSAFVDSYHADTALPPKAQKETLPSGVYVPEKQQNSNPLWSQMVSEFSQLEQIATGPSENTPKREIHSDEKAITEKDIKPKLPPAEEAPVRLSSLFISGGKPSKT